MSGPGYIIRTAHVQAAIDKATPEERRSLESLLEQVAELDALEQSLAKRVGKAQSDAGIARPTLSKAAKDAMSQSADANSEIDRVLTRKCNRADSAVATVKEILAIAKGDMKVANTFDNWIENEDPTKAIHSEMYWKKRKLVEALRKFVVEGER